MLETNRAAAGAPVMLFFSPAVSIGSVRRAERRACDICFFLLSIVNYGVEDARQTMSNVQGKVE